MSLTVTIFFSLSFPIEIYSHFNNKKCQLLVLTKNLFSKNFWGFFIGKFLTAHYRAGSDCVGGVSNLDHFREPNGGSAFQAAFLHIHFKAA
jgi:hypothetical protein